MAHSPRRKNEFVDANQRVSESVLPQEYDREKTEQATANGRQ
jgi:hypothetical protein